MLEIKLEIGLGSLLRKVSFPKFRAAFEVFADLLDEAFLFAFSFLLMERWMPFAKYKLLNKCCHESIELL